MIVLDDNTEAIAAAMEEKTTILNCIVCDHVFILIDLDTRVKFSHDDYCNGTCKSLFKIDKKRYITAYSGNAGPLMQRSGERAKVKIVDPF